MSVRCVSPYAWLQAVIQCRTVIQSLVQKSHSTAGPQDPELELMSELIPRLIGERTPVCLPTTLAELIFSPQCQHKMTTHCNTYTGD